MTDQEILGKIFKLKTSQIYVLNSPSSFKDAICSILIKAKNRICISALYIDDENEVTSTLSRIIENNNLNNKENPNIRLVLDYNRMTRRSDTLIPYTSILNRFPNSLKVSLCEIPINGTSKRLFDGITSRFINILSRYESLSFFKEVFGVYHVKLYLADNDVIITGANISSGYLSNKQDRYILLKDVKEICDYFEQVLKILSNYSYEIFQNNKILPPKNSKFGQIKEELLKLNDQFDLKDELTSQIQKRIEDNTKSDECTLFVYFQCGCIKILSEKQLLTRVLSFCNKEDTDLVLAVPYLNIPEYIKTIFKEKIRNLQIITGVPIKTVDLKSCEKYSIFDKVRTLILPRLYSNINYSLLNQLLKRGNPNVKLFEYTRPNWSFHFKGIYVFKSKKDQLSKEHKQNYLLATAFGSSNYNFRSMNKDFECSFILVPPVNRSFENVFRKELSNITYHSVKRDAPKITLRRFFLTKFLEYIKGYL